MWVNIQFYDEWRVSAALSWMCEHGCDVEQCGSWSRCHAVTSHDTQSSLRVTTAPPPPVFARRQGKVPIFTHFSGSLIQEFSYSLEFSYSHTLLMNLQWDTFTWPARPSHRPALLHSHQITHAIKSIQAEAKSKATVYCSDTRYLRN